MRDNFIIQCFLLIRVGWECRIYKGICTSSALYWKKIKTLQDWSFLNFSWCLVNEIQRLRKRLLAMACRRSTGSITGFLLKVSHKIAAHLPSFCKFHSALKTTSLQAFKQNASFLGKYFIGWNVFLCFHFWRRNHQIFPENFCWRGAERLNIWRSSPVHEFPVFYQKKRRNLRELYLLGYFLCLRILTFLVHHMVFQELSSHFLCCTCEFRHVLIISLDRNTNAWLQTYKLSIVL